jgi:hypothetical protein
MTGHPSAEFFKPGSFIALFLLCLTGCGSGTTATPPPTQTYPFQAAVSYEWVQEFGASDLPVFGNILPYPTQVITGIAADTTGDVVAAGYDLGSFGVLANPDHFGTNFVTKYDSNGKQIWLQQFGTEEGDFLNNVAVDASNNIYAVGTTHGALAGASNPNGIDEGTIFKMVADGSLAWQQQFTIDNAFTYPTAIAVAPDDSIILGGVYSSHTDATSAFLFVEKLDASSGAMLWQVKFGTGASASLDGLGCDSNGDVYIAAQTTGSFPGQAAGPSTSSLVKLSGADGTGKWAQVISEPNLAITTPLGLAVGSKAIVVGGATSNKFTTIGSSADIAETAFLASFNPSDGSTQWNKVLSTSYGDEITGVGVSAAGDVYALGETNGLFARGFTQPADNMMLLKFSPDGTNLSDSQFGTGPIINQEAGIGPQMAISPTGAIYIGGPIQTPFPGFSNPNNELQLFIARFAQ